MLKSNLKSSKDCQPIWTTSTRKNFLFTPVLYGSWRLHELMQPWSGFETSYNRFYEQASLVPPRKKRTTLLTEHDLREGEMILPFVHYEGFLKISSEKYKYLQHLKRFFCS
uniref:Uncharacterized protein n=1 Tax=Timema poppense TaxID=170557 RepID=A0A7R9DG54_TIMPO|nr:unnamed protein product [Timema poppensis]